MDYIARATLTLILSNYLYFFNQHNCLERQEGIWQVVGKLCYEILTPTFP